MSRHPGEIAGAPFTWREGMTVNGLTLAREARPGAWLVRCDECTDTSAFSTAALADGRATCCR